MRNGSKESNGRYFVVSWRHSRSKGSTYLGGHWSRFICSADQSRDIRGRASQAELEQARVRSSARLLHRQRALQAKIDRGYAAYVERRISEALWARKSAEWETELATVSGELSAVDRPVTA
jgi:hypothetical protein